MARLATPDDVLKARGTNENMPDAISVANHLLDLVTPLVEHKLDTPLERYARTDLFSHSASVYSHKYAPIVFRLSQGYVDLTAPFVLYEPRRGGNPIKYVIPEVTTPVMEFADTGAMDSSLLTVPSHLGTITENWVITFESDTEFQVEGETLGQIENVPFDVADNLEILNPAISEPYFVIPALAWTGVFVAGDTVTFSTTAADTKIIEPRDYIVDYVKGLVTLQRWVATGPFTYAARYTAGFHDDGDMLEGVPVWMKAASVSAVVRYMNAHTSRWNVKKGAHMESQQNEIYRFIAEYLHPHIRPRYGMTWSALTQAMFEGYTE